MFVAAITNPEGPDCVLPEAFPDRIAAECALCRRLFRSGALFGETYNSDGYGNIADGFDGDDETAEAIQFLLKNVPDFDARVRACKTYGKFLQNFIEDIGNLPRAGFRLEKDLALFLEPEMFQIVEVPTPSGTN
jgi:hypothetical protein